MAGVEVGAASTADSFQLPLDADWVVTQDFNVYNSDFGGYHLGEDVLRSSEVPVYAPANGVVKHNSQRTSYGYVVIIEHQLPDGSYVTSVLGHLRNEGRASIGSVVSKGQIVGYLSSDSTENGGYSFTHLHFGIRKGSYSSTWVYYGYGTSSDVNDWHDPSDFVNANQNDLNPVPISGDLNGDGIDTYGTFDPITNIFKFGSKSVLFAMAGDLPVMGDWDHDGKDEIGVYRPNEAGTGQSYFYLVTRDWDTLPSYPINVGSADCDILFGPYPNNIPLAGDWDGDGDDDVGGFYPPNNNFYLYILDLTSSSVISYPSHPSVPFGINGDKPIIGDWDGDGDDDVGVHRGFDPDYSNNLVFYFDLDLSGGQSDLNPAPLGNNGDIAVIGDWDGDGDDNIGGYRPSTSTFYTDSNKPVLPNRAPTINSYLPASLTPSVDEGSSLSFSASASDPDGTTPSYSWKLGSVQQSTSSSWTYSPGYSDSGTKTVTLTVSDGSLTATKTWTVTVNDADFTISASPASQSIAQGSSTTYSISLTSLNGFNSAVTLSASGLPAGATTSFSPSSVTPTGSSTLNIQTSASTPPDSYSLTITGIGGEKTHTATATLVVSAEPDFTISALPPSQSIAQGSSTTYSISLTSLNGFNSAVTLSASGLPAGATTSFSPSSVTPTGSSTLNIQTSASTPPDSYSLTITGIGGGKTHTATATLVVSDADGIVGDINGDGSVTSVDALMVLQMTVGNIAETSSADINGDGSVTSVDALMILQAVVGNITL